MLTLTIETDNAAFEDEPGVQCAWILRRIAAKLEAGHESGATVDVNGNNVGEWELTGEAEVQS